MRQAASKFADRARTALSPGPPRRWRAPVQAARVCAGAAASGVARYGVSRCCGVWLWADQVPVVGVPAEVVGAAAPVVPAVVPRKP